MVAGPGDSALSAPAAEKSSAVAIRAHRTSDSISINNATTEMHRRTAYQPNHTPARALKPTMMPLVTVRNPNIRAEFFNLGGGYALDVRQLIDGLERTVGLPVCNDATGKYVADAR